MELKPCPFCGSSSIDNNDGDDWMEVSCLSCGAVGPDFDYCVENNDMSQVDAWNQRTEQEVDGEATQAQQEC